MSKNSCLRWLMTLGILAVETTSDSIGSASPIDFEEWICLPVNRNEEAENGVVAAVVVVEELERRITGQVTQAM